MEAKFLPDPSGHESELNQLLREGWSIHTLVARGEHGCLCALLTRMVDAGPYRTTPEARPPATRVPSAGRECGDDDAAVLARVREVVREWESLSGDPVSCAGEEGRRAMRTEYAQLEWIPCDDCGLSYKILSDNDPVNLAPSITNEAAALNATARLGWNLLVYVQHPKSHIVALLTRTTPERAAEDEPTLDRVREVVESWSNNDDCRVSLISVVAMKQIRDLVKL